MTKKLGINQYWLGIKLGINLLSSALSIRNLFSIALSLTLTVPCKTNFMFWGYLTHFLRFYYPLYYPPREETEWNGYVNVRYRRNQMPFVIFGRNYRNPPSRFLVYCSCKKDFR